jgi:alkylation response protein AidB-like acyl-CoA dehydrogenase
MEKAFMKSRDEMLSIASDLAARFSARAEQHAENGDPFPYENFEDIRASGYPLLPVPAEYGGWGASLLDAVQAQELLGSGDGSTALAITMHVQVVGGEATARAWQGEAFEKLCRRIVEERALVNATATEPELGSPMRGGLPRTTAHRNGSGWIINGRKSFATLSPVLDYFILPAALEGQNQTGTFLVDRQPGIVVEPTWDTLGMRGTGSHDIVLNDVHVPDDNLLAQAEVAPGSTNTLGAGAWFTLTVSAVYLGIAVAAHRFALKYAQERIPTALGRPIATLESIQRRLGEAEFALQVARTLLYDAASAWDRDPEGRGNLGEKIAVAKMTVTNNAIHVVDHAMRVVGGTSLYNQSPLARYYSDVRAGLYHPPVDDATFSLLGRLALERDAAARKPQDEAAREAEKQG